MAPEVIDIWDTCLQKGINSHDLMLAENFESHHHKLRGYDFSSDLYSLGVLIWEIVEGTPPYGYLQANTTTEERLAYFKSTRDPLPEHTKYPKGSTKSNLMNLAVRLMAKVPEERLGYGKNFK